MASSTAGEPQKRLQEEVEKYQTYQRDFQKMAKTRQQLEAQMTENTMVKQELDLIKDDSAVTVYKLVGPVLAKQEIAEAKQNVTKRLDYINSEIKRVEAMLKDLEKKRTDQQEIVRKCQLELQQAQGALGSPSVAPKASVTG